MSSYRGRLKLDGWYERKLYAHFDVPMPFQAAKSYVTNPEQVRRHGFFPFLTFTKHQRRFTTKDGGAMPKPSTKSRPLAMPAHLDGYVFAWYAYSLSRLYEAALHDAGLAACVLAYRAGIGTNVRMAEDAFVDIASRPACLAVALDLENFFPSIDHVVLRQNWARVLGQPGLPSDHYAVFRAMTRFAEVDKAKCYERLGIIAGEGPIPKPLCNGKQYREVIRRGPPGAGTLVTVNGLTHGIPQGAQISALLSNIYMLNFDIAMRDAAKSMGGTYRRYSDDILFVVAPQWSGADVVQRVASQLPFLGSALKLNAKKTEVVRFGRDSAERLYCDRKHGIQYLGFTFDGERRLVRSQTMSKYARRLTYAVRAAKRAAKANGTPVYRRAIYRQFSHLGRSNFISRYVASAQDAMSGNAIRKQVRRHMRRISDAFDCL